jgi:outer membrane protein assembly factor BamB
MGTIGAVTTSDRLVDDEPILIELDLTTEWTPLDSTTAAPRQGFWITIVLAPLMVLALLAGGGRVPTLDPVFTLGMGTLQRELIGDVLYVTPRSVDELRAYDLRTRRLMWSRPTTEGDLQWARHGEIITISKTAAADGLPAVEVLDGATGRALWRRSAAVVVGGGATSVVLRQFSAPAAGTKGYPLRTSQRAGEGSRVLIAEQTSLVGLDARAGTTIWSRQVPLTAATFTLASPGRGVTNDGRGVLVVDSDGVIRAMDLATGEVIATPGADEWQLRSEGRADRPVISCLVYLSGLQAGTMNSRAVCLPDAIRGIATGATWAPEAGSGDLSVEIDEDGTAVGTASGRLRVLARIPEGMVDPTCRGSGNYLMCYAGAMLGVWRLETSTLRSSKSK